MFPYKVDSYYNLDGKAKAFTFYLSEVYVK